MPEIHIEQRSSPSFNYKPTMPSKWTWIQVGSGIVLLSSAAAFAVIFFTPQLSGLFLVAPGVTGIASLALFGAIAVRKCLEKDYVFSEVIEQQGSLKRSSSKSISNSAANKENLEEKKSLTLEITDPPFTDESDQGTIEAQFRADFTVTLLTIQDENLEKQTEPEIFPDVSAPASASLLLNEEDRTDVDANLKSQIAPESPPEVPASAPPSTTGLIKADLESHREPKMQPDNLARPPTPPPLPPTPPISPSRRLLKEENAEKVIHESKTSHLSDRFSTAFLEAFDGVQAYWKRLDEIDLQIPLEKDPGKIHLLFAERESLEKAIQMSFSDETEETFIDDSQETSKGMITHEVSSDSLPELSEMERCWEKIEETKVRLSFVQDQKERQRLLDEKEALESEYEKLLMGGEENIFPDVTNEAEIEDVPEVKLRSKKDNKELEKLKDLNALYTDRTLEIADRLVCKIEEQEREALALELEQLSKKVEDNLRKIFEFSAGTEATKSSSSKMEEEDAPAFQIRGAKKPEVTGTKLFERHFPPVFKAIETLLQDFLIAHYQTSNPKKPEETEKKYNSKVISETRARAQKISTALAAIYKLLLTHVDNCEKISALNEKELKFDKEIDANFTIQPFLDFLLVVETTFKEETKNKEEKFSKALKSYLKPWKINKPLWIILKSIVSENNLFEFRPNIGELKSKSPQDLKLLHRKVMQQIIDVGCARFKEDPLLYSTQNPTLAISSLFPTIDFRLFDLFAPLYLKMTAEILDSNKEEALHNLLKAEFVENRMKHTAVWVSQDERAQLIKLIKDYSFDQLYDFFLTDRIESELVEISPRLREMEMELTIRLDPKKPIVIKCFSLEIDNVPRLLEENADVNKALKDHFSEEIYKFNENLAKSGKHLVAIQSGNFSLIYWIKSVLGDLQGGYLSKIVGKGLSLASVVVDGETVLNLINKYLGMRGKKPILVELPGFTSAENAVLKKNVCIILENLLVPIYDVLLASKGSPLQKRIQNFVDREGIIGKLVLEIYPKLAQSMDISPELVVETTCALQREISQAINPNKINLNIS